MADPAQDNLLREIQEDLRREKLETLWKRYGAWLIGAAVAVVLAVAAFQAWRAWQVSRLETQSEAFMAAEALARTEPGAAVPAFAALSDEDGLGYGLLAGFREAALLAQQGRHEDAVDAYERIAGGDSDALYRDLATLQAIALRLDMNNGPAELDGLADRLSRLNEDSNPWRFSARELAAALALQRGDAAKARELFASLEADIETPRGIRARASEMLSRIAPPPGDATAPSE